MAFDALTYVDNYWENKWYNCLHLINKGIALSRDKERGSWRSKITSLEGKSTPRLRMLTRTLRTASQNTVTVCELFHTLTTAHLLFPTLCKSSVQKSDGQLENKGESPTRETGGDSLGGACRQKRHPRTESQGILTLEAEGMRGRQRKPRNHQPAGKQRKHFNLKKKHQVIKLAYGQKEESRNTN